jgi:hypothetical protein
MSASAGAARGCAWRRPMALPRRRGGSGIRRDAPSPVRRALPRAHRGIRPGADIRPRSATPPPDTTGRPHCGEDQRDWCRSARCPVLCLGHSGTGGSALRERCSRGTCTSPRPARRAPSRTRRT